MHNNIFNNSEGFSQKRKNFVYKAKVDGASVHDLKALQYFSTVLNGYKVARNKEQEIKNKVQHIKDNSGITPCLVIIQVGEHAPSDIYIKEKIKKAT